MIEYEVILPERERMSIEMTVYSITKHYYDRVYGRLSGPCLQTAVVALGVEPRLSGRASAGDCSI